jgi:hypothetical protein
VQGTRQLFMLLQGGPEGRESGARVTKMLRVRSGSDALPSNVLASYVALL